MASRSLVLQFLADTTGIKKGVGEVNRKLDGFRKTTMAVGKVVGAAFSAKVAYDFAASITRMGEKMNNVSTAFKRTGADLSALRIATQGTVSDISLMEKSVLAVKLGIDAAKLPQYFEFAAQTAAETGQNVDYLVESIVTGIGRQSVLIMDNLGIQMKGARREGESFADAAERIMKELGGSNSQLALSSVDKLETSFVNLYNTVSKIFAPAGNALFEAINKQLVKMEVHLLDLAKRLGMDVGKGLKDFQKDVDKANAALQDYEMRIDAGVRGASQFSREHRELKDAVRDAENKLGDYLKTLGGPTDTGGGTVTGGLNAAKKAAKSLAETLAEDLGKSLDEAVEFSDMMWQASFNKLVPALDAQYDAFAENATAVKNLGTELTWVGSGPVMPDVLTKIEDTSKALDFNSTKWLQLGTAISSTLSNIGGGGDILSNLTGLINTIGAMTGPIGNIVAAAWNIGVTLGQLIKSLFGNKNKPDGGTFGPHNPPNALDGVDTTPQDGDVMGDGKDMNQGGQGGPGRGGTTVIVNGFVGNEEDLAEQIDSVINRNPVTNNTIRG